MIIFNFMFNMHLEIKNTIREHNKKNKNKLCDNTLNN